ncbi:ribosomal protein L1p/L10e family-domain-containing protein [Choanephora cucurbitarum]|nr:ribosomal protein L1p/L10e family-domain-containing protein [Choanephora cucurbitarum]
MAQNVNLKQAKKAITALFKHNETKPDNDMLGSEEEAGIYVEITTHKIMNKESLKKKKVALPFTPYAETMEVCYITKDDEKTVENRLKEESVTEIKKVISKKALETTYKAYEAKRKLADSYDMFLVDDRIAHLMPSLVGKKFFEKNKQSTGSLKKHVEDALKATYIKLHNNRTSLVLIGNFGMDQKDVLKNYEAALPNIVKITAHNWEEVQLFGIKSKSSPLLPIYAAFPKVEEKAVKKAKTEKAELPVKAEMSVKVEKSVKTEKPVKATKVEKVEKSVKIEKKKTTTALKSQIKKRSAKK